jgi:hypothetical protein
VSVLDGFLKQDLSFRDGLAELLNGTEVRQWLEIGGAAEDQFLGSELLGAASRSRHHFHNPLASWDLAGLDAISLCPPFRLSGQASVRWAQNPSQGISGQAAWGDARNRFIDSLILSSRTRRYAARLLPRAVGYSAALLDYFFRNRFDVDLLPDTNDPSLVRVSGTNASSDPNAFADPLVDGTLKLYKDAADGTRSEVAALDPVGFVGVPGGGPVTSARFQLPPDAERFVAVYQGTLGNEIKDPSRNFPGGVIGKVLGGYRVEQLFPDGTRWNLRTPKGIFPLPILQADVVDLRWGDLDNTLVGRSVFTSQGVFGSQGPNLMFAYWIKRSLGSVDVPLVNGMVDVEEVARVTFPFGLDIGVDVQLNAGLNYRQYLVSIFRSQVVSGNTIVSRNVTGATAEVVVGPISAAATFTWRLTLDADKFDNFRARPHIWEIRQIGLTAEGHIVALVMITLNPSIEVASFPSKRYVTPCGAATCPTPPTVQDGPPVSVPYGLGRVPTGAVWALVDVSDQKVLYSTAPSTAVINSTAPSTLVINNTIEVTGFGASCTGGSGVFGLCGNAIVETTNKDDGSVSYGIVQSGGFLCTTTGPTSAQVEVRSGVISASQTHLRDELGLVEFPPAPPQHLVSVATACVDFIAVSVTTDSALAFQSFIPGAFRAADGSGRVVLLVERQTVPGAPTFGNPQTRVIAWDASQTPATARLALAFPGGRLTRPNRALA